MIEIKRWDTGAVIFKSETATTVADALNEGVQCGCLFARADLTGADLTGADLAGAYLTRANLVGANLVGADLAGANLTGADLTGANLTGADLAGAYLTRANLVGANLVGANLVGANLVGAENSALAIAMTRILPSEGEVIGWKKCQGNILVKLRVPPEAKRCHAFGRKCRAEFVEVLEVVGAEIGISKHDGITVYRAGERVTCDKWEPDFTQECAGGIHFFITREEAENY